MVAGRLERDSAVQAAQRMQQSQEIGGLTGSLGVVVLPEDAVDPIS